MGCKQHPFFQSNRFVTVLSVNLNKLALLRNSRGRNYPDLCQYARRFIALGAGGITLHPRPDERHIRHDDVPRLKAVVDETPGIELNIEGYPDERLMALVEAVRPHQCTLVPDAPDQLTSDHGWDFHGSDTGLEPVLRRLRDLGVRSAVFLDPDPTQVEGALEAGADRIELYTEDFARHHGGPEADRVQARYRATAAEAVDQGLGVNAGHDLSLDNLDDFLDIPDILEVSIGHALTVECIDHGIETVMQRYLAICRGRH